MKDDQICPKRSLLPLLLCLAGWGLATMLPNPALASEKGLRLEMGPDFSFTRFNNGSVGDWTTSGSLAMEAWSGAFGIMGDAIKGAGISQVELTAAGLVPTITYTTQVAIGPTANIHPGPVHLRLGIGPWFANSIIRSEMPQSSDLGSFWMDWSGLRFMGLMTELRADINLPILSPFAAVSIHGQSTLPIAGQTDGTSDYQAVDLRGTAGLRLNVVPFVKLSLAGFAGQTQYTLEGPQTAQALSNSYGLSLWMVIKL